MSLFRGCMRTFLADCTRCKRRPCSYKGVVDHPPSNYKNEFMYGVNVYYIRLYWRRRQQIVKCTICFYPSKKLVGHNHLISFYSGILIATWCLCTCCVHTGTHTVLLKSFKWAINCFASLLMISFELWTKTCCQEGYSSLALELSKWM